MNSFQRFFDSRGLATQFVWVTLAAAVVAAALGWAIRPGTWEVSLSVLAGGLAAAMAGALLARRMSRALAEIGIAARSLSQDDGPAESNVPLLESCEELRRASLNLRHLIEVFRQRQQALMARNAALGRQLEDRTHELTTLEDLSIGLATKSDLHELIDEALTALEQTLEYSSASVWGREGREAPGQVVLMGYRTGEGVEAGASARDLRGMRLSRPNLQRYEQIEREREPIIDNRARQSLLSWLWSKVTDDTRTSALYHATRAWMAVPLKVRDDVLGVLRVDHYEQDYFDAERARLLTAVGSQAALAMRHARLLEQERDVAVMAERNRIARDLHDAVSQTLFAANVVAGTLARMAARESSAGAATLQAQAATLERLNLGALAEMRLLMFELRPDALEHAELADLLQQAIQALVCRSEISVDQKLSRGDNLGAPIRIQLYRIAQEALSNIVRHSGATQVSIEWTVHTPRNAILRIADNGKGFDPDEPVPGHFGVGNMRSRASEIGATFSLTSAPGQGTEIRVELN